MIFCLSAHPTSCSLVEMYDIDYLYGKWKGFYDFVYNNGRIKLTPLNAWKSHLQICAANTCVRDQKTRVKWWKVSSSDIIKIHRIVRKTLDTHNIDGEYDTNTYQNAYIGTSALLLRKFPSAKTQHRLLFKAIHVCRKAIRIIICDEYRCSHKTNRHSLPIFQRVFRMDR
ncbi:unnamed protein product [Albugo candida]|uniref:Uncharacterized protein n=1 Tax=Albugo candida TaxID=65357 RepID=A0A024GNQ6_9STRA|nr:unnamed protein product [Albugo candida]|eukprot:CCI47967.1 unnamed protein product [Albugo candida]